MDHVVFVCVRFMPHSSRPYHLTPFHRTSNPLPFSRWFFPLRVLFYTFFVCFHSGRLFSQAWTSRGESPKRKQKPSAACFSRRRKNPPQKVLPIVAAGALTICAKLSRHAFPPFNSFISLANNQLEALFHRYNGHELSDVFATRISEFHSDMLSRSL